MGTTCLSGTLVTLCIHISLDSELFGDDLWENDILSTVKRDKILVLNIISIGTWLLHIKLTAISELFAA